MKRYTKVIIPFVLVVLIGLISGCNISKFGNGVAFLRAYPSYVCVTQGDKVDLRVTAFDVKSKPINTSIESKITGGGTLSSSGTFQATELGHHEIAFWVNGQAEIKVPVTVVPDHQSQWIEILTDFTSAVESDDLVRALGHLSGDFTFDDGEQVHEVDYFEEYIPLIKAWSVGEITIESEDTITILSGIGNIETSSLESGIHTINKYSMNFVFETMSNGVKINKVQLIQLPSDYVNPPNVKAVIEAPVGEVINLGTLFEYYVGYRNLGGKGYLLCKYAITDPHGSGGTVEVFPEWIESNATITKAFGGGGLMENPGEIVLEVEIYSGPTPNNMILTDQQVIKYRVE